MITVPSLLVTGEAGQLAEDYFKICESKFPANNMAIEAQRLCNSKSSSNTPCLSGALFKDIV